MIVSPILAPLVHEVAEISDCMRDLGSASIAAIVCVIGVRSVEDVGISVKMLPQAKMTPVV